MANVQIDNGEFTRIANVILEKLSSAKLNGCQYAIVLTIWRYTYGFQRKEHELSSSFLSTATNFDKRQIQRDLKILEDRNIIFQKVKSGISRIIGFNKDYDSWTSGEKTYGEYTDGEKADGENTDPPTVNLPQATYGESTTQERKSFKENLKDSSSSSGGEINEIEFHFLKKRGKGNQISIPDYQEVKKALEYGIPVEFIKSGIDKAFRDYKPKHQKDEIRSLSFCIPKIYDDWHTHLEKQKVGGNVVSITESTLRHGNPSSYDKPIEGKSGVLPSKWYKPDESTLSVQEV